VLRNARSGIELLLGSHPGSDVAAEHDLFGRGIDSVRLTKRCWGAFEIALSTAHRRNETEELIALVGWQDANDNTALVLADLDRPLAITGQSELRGDCYLPVAGIKRAYIEGQSYGGDRLVYGQEKKAPRFLPPCNDTLVKKLLALFDFIPVGDDSVFPLEMFSATDSIYNSFRNKPLFIFASGALMIDAQDISGQVCIVSRTKITIGKNASITNALLVAPEIEIEKDAEGQFQAFARDTLIVHENVRLHYPSVLGIIGTARSADVALLQMKKGSHIMGQLFGAGTSSDFRKRVLIAVDANALVYGSIYCADLVDLKGSVFGDVTCAKFELRTNSAVYENHLLSAVINRSKRSPEFAASALSGKKGSRKTVVQWLD
jgi:hypothetical protein